jgi:hypothetical protein
MYLAPWPPLVRSQLQVASLEACAHIQDRQVSTDVISVALQVFRELLRLGRRFGAAELEAVLVASPGDDGLLPEIHMVRLAL